MPPSSFRVHGPVLVMAIRFQIARGSIGEWQSKSQRRRQYNHRGLRDFSFFPKGKILMLSFAGGAGSRDKSSSEWSGVRLHLDILSLLRAWELPSNGFCAMVCMCIENMHLSDRLT